MALSAEQEPTLGASGSAKAENGRHLTQHPTLVSWQLYESLWSDQVCLRARMTLGRADPAYLCTKASMPEKGPPPGR